MEERVRLQGYLKGTLNYRYGLVEEKLLNLEGNTCGRMDSLWVWYLCFTCGRMDSLEINCFSNVIRKELRNGKNISFWMDFWLGEQPFNLNFPLHTRARTHTLSVQVVLEINWCKFVAA